MSARAVLGRAYRGALPTLVLSAVGGLLAGVVLGDMNEDLAAVRGLLVMIPAFLAIRGSVYGALGSRLSSALHQGFIEPVLEPDDRLVAAMLAAVLNGLLASTFAAVLAFLVLSALGRGVAPLATLLAIALMAGVLAGIALAGTIVVAVIVGFRRGLDPDTLIGPVMTTAGDVFGMLSLFLATKLVLALT